MVLCPKLWIWIPGAPRSSNPEFQTKYHSITPSFTAKRSQSIGDACGTLSEPHPTPTRHSTHTASRSVLSCACGRRQHAQQWQRCCRAAVLHHALRPDGGLSVGRNGRPATARPDGSPRDLPQQHTRTVVRYVGRAWGQWGQKYLLERETGFEGGQNSLCSQVRDVSGVLAVGGGHGTA